MLNKKRLDVMLFERGLTQSREKARTVIMAGNVYVDNQKADKPGTLFKDDVKIEVRSPRINYVSRGGLKLEKAIKAFKIELNGKVAMDIGASTGGFYRLHATKWSEKSLFCRCGVWSARLEAAQ